MYCRSSQSVNKTISRTLLDQTVNSTWAGFDQNILETLRRQGCAICSIGTYLNKTASQLISLGYCIPTSQEVQSWGSFNTIRTGNFYDLMAKQILWYNKPVIVFVPGKGTYPTHYVVANHIKGIIECDPDGIPLCTNIRPDVIKILDPYHRNCKSLAELENLYGTTQNIRYI